MTTPAPEYPGNREPYGPNHNPPFSAEPGQPPPFQPPISDPAYSPYTQSYGQQYAPPYSQFAPPAPPPPPGTNGFAVASFVLSFCGGLLSVIFGIVALRQIRKTGQKGKGLAIAGLCISGCWLLLLAAGGILSYIHEPKRDASGTITSEGKVSVNSLKTGDCIKSLKETEALFSLPVVPCDQAHEGEVVGEFKLTGNSYPGDREIESQALERCESIVIDYTSAATLKEVDDLYYLYPRKSDWSKGSRSITCIALTAPSRSGSLKG